MCNFISRRTQKISRNVSAVLNTRSVSNLRPLDSAITVAQHQQQISPQNKQVYKVFKSHWGKRSLRDVQINQEWGRPPRERERERAGQLSVRYSVMQSSWHEQITCGFIMHWESKAWLQSGLKNKLTNISDECEFLQSQNFTCTLVLWDWSVWTGQSCFPTQRPRSQILKITQIVFLAYAGWHS